MTTQVKSPPSPNSFTPGPWEYRALKNGWAIFPANAPRDWSLDDVVCGCEADYDPLWDKEPSEADRRLIAVAPQLYDAAYDAWKCLDLLRSYFADEEKALEMIDAHLDELETALTKARGEQ